MVLLDSGSTVNLTPRTVVRKLGVLIYRAKSEKVITIANGLAYALTDFAVISVNISGVANIVVTWIMDGPTPFSMLLGREYMAQVGIIEDHGIQQVFIRADDGSTHRVVPSQRRVGPVAGAPIPLASSTQNAPSHRQVFDMGVVDSSDVNWADETNALAAEALQSAYDSDDDEDWETIEPSSSGTAHRS